MRQVILKGLATRKLRATLTAIAILLGVAMVSGTFAITDQIGRAFDNIFLKARATTDIVVTKPASFTADQTGDIVPFPQEVVDAVRKVDGVAIAEPLVQGLGGLIVNGKYKGSTGGAPPLVFSILPKPFDTNAYVAGHPPLASGEVAILESMANDEKITVGTKAKMATETGAEDVTVVGIFKSNADFGGATVVTGTFADVQRWVRSEGKVQEIDVAAADGVSKDALLKAIQAAVGPDLTVESGRDRALAESRQISDGINSFLGPALGIFAAIAVFVSAFIIFNTFSITVGQRIRELAMLRTLGANRRQILSSVMVEATIVAVVATAIGLVTGLAFAAGLLALMDAVGFGLPSAGLTLAPRTIVVGSLIGVGVTLLAAFAPAFRATRIPPIAAVREGSELPRSWLSRKAPYIAPVIVLIGGGLVALSFFGDQTTSQRLLTMGAGVLVSIIGVALVAKWLIRPLARGVGAPVERVTGLMGRLARENATRNPGRTAVTAAALMIGVTVSTFFAIFAAGLEQSISDALGTSLKSEMLVQSSSFGGMPPGVVPLVQKVPGVKAVVPVESAEVRVNGSQDGLTAAPADFTTAYRLDWVTGSDDLLANLGPGDAIAEREWAQGRKLVVGSTLAVETQEGGSATYTIRGIFNDKGFISTFVISPAAYRQLVPKETLGVALVKFADGANGDTTERAVKAVVDKAYPQLKAQSNREVLDEASNQIGQLLGLIYGLLGLVVVISLFGIVNTLVLSIYERTREIGLLRAIGTTRRQMRRIIRYESVITSVIGAILGIVLGIGFGFLGTKAVDTIGFVLPVGQLVIFLIVAIVCGLLAAILPARRAAKLDVLAALQYE